FFFCRLGLWLTVLSPAAAWYIVFLVGRFLPSRGQKTTHKGVNITVKRKSYRLFFARQAKNNLQKPEDCEIVIRPCIQLPRTAQRPAETRPSQPPISHTIDI